MIKYSTTFPDRSVCKFCLKPADVIQSKSYITEVFSGKDLYRDENFDPKYLVPTSIFETFIKNRKYGKFKLGYVDYVNQNSIKTSYYRRKINSYRIKGNELPKISFCPCGKSYWIDHSFSNNVVIENHRKSKI